MQRLLFVLLLMVQMLGTTVQLTAATYTYFPTPANQVPEHIRDGFDDPRDGLSTTNGIEIDVDRILTPITKVAVSIIIYHPHLNDLKVDIIAPNGLTVNLLDNISTATAPFNHTAFGFVGGIGTGLNEVTLVSVSEDSATKRINDLLILEQNPTSPYYLNTVPPGTYYSMGDLGAFNGLEGLSANGTWILRVVDDSQNNWSDDHSEYYYYQQPLVFVSLSITQEGGDKVWTGLGTDDFWGNDDNWDPKFGAPEFGQQNSLIFPAGTPRPNPVHNLANGGQVLEIAEIKFSGGNYNITGNNIRYAKSARIINSLGNNIVNLNATMVANARIEVNVPVGQLTLPANIAGNGRITKKGNSNVILSGNNTGYTGYMIVSNGYVDVQNANALGATGAGQETSIEGGTVRTGGLGNIAEPFAVYGMGEDGNGALHITGNQTITGQMTLWEDFSTGSGFNVDAAATLIVSNFKAASGSHRLRLTGGGTMQINAGVNAQLPGKTSLFVTNSTLETNNAQPSLGSIILSNGIVSGSGAITPLGAGEGTAPADITSTGTSGIFAPIALGGANRSVKVADGTLTILGAMSNGSISKSGGGTLDISSVSSTVSVAIGEGSLIGNGQVNALSMSTNTSLNPTGTFTAANASFANQSALILDALGENLTVSGSASLGGVNGIGGALLLLYEGVAANAVVVNGPNSGTFDGFPDGVGITYTPATNVVLTGGADGGKTVWFDPNAYTVNESDGSVTVTTVWSAAPGTAVLRNYGGSIRRDIDITINYNDTGFAGGGSLQLYTIPIIDNFIETGTINTILTLIPRAGARIALTPPTGGPTATLTIIDNDVTEKKKCGFGTGLTVFFLMGFGLLLQLRLRRR